MCHLWCDEHSRNVDTKSVAVSSRNSGVFPLFDRSSPRCEGEREATKSRGACVVPLRTANTPALSAGTVVIVEFFSCRGYFRGGGERERAAEPPAAKISTCPCRNVIRADVHCGCTYSYISLHREIFLRMITRSCKIRSSFSAFLTAATIDIFTLYLLTEREREKGEEGGKEYAIHSWKKCFILNY